MIDLRRRGMPGTLNHVRDVTQQNFGLLIGFVIPGFLVLWGLSYNSATVETWLGTASDAPTVGGFLYVTIASVALGMTVSTIRWLLVDSLHHLTGIKQPAWRFSHLRDRTDAFNVLIEIHYRFYQFYGGSLIALLLAFPLRWSALGVSAWEVVLMLAMGALFFAGSRDTLKKYYLRVEALLDEGSP